MHCVNCLTIDWWIDAIKIETFSVLLFASLASYSFMSLVEWVYRNTASNEENLVTLFKTCTLLQLFSQNAHTDRWVYINVWKDVSLQSCIALLKTVNWQ